MVRVDLLPPGPFGLGACNKVIDFFLSASCDPSPRLLITSLMSLLGETSVLCLDLEAGFLGPTSLAVEGLRRPATGLEGFPLFIVSAALGDCYGGDHLAGI